MTHDLWEHSRDVHFQPACTLKKYLSPPLPKPLAKPRIAALFAPLHPHSF